MQVFLLVRALQAHRNASACCCLLPQNSSELRRWLLCANKTSAEGGEQYKHKCVRNKCSACSIPESGEVLPTRVRITKGACGDVSSNTTNMFCWCEEHDGGDQVGVTIQQAWPKGFPQ
jgi:hypothetical protein